MLEIHYLEITNRTPYPNKVLSEKHTHLGMSHTHTRLQSIYSTAKW